MHTRTGTNRRIDRLTRLSRAALLAGLAASLAATGGAHAADVENLFDSDIDKLPKFETRYEGGKAAEGRERMPAPWAAGHWHAGSSALIGVDDAPGLEGRRAWRIDALGPEAGAQVYNWRPVKLGPGQRYAVRFDYLTAGNAEGRFELRTDQGRLEPVEQRGALSVQSQHEGQRVRYELQPAESWSTFEAEFATGDAPAEVKLFFLERQAEPGGALWFRDVRVESLGSTGDGSSTASASTPTEALGPHARSVREELSGLGVAPGDWIMGADETATLDALVWKFHHGAGPGMVEREIVDVQDMPFDKALRVRSKELGRLDWSLQLNTGALGVSVAEGEPMWLSFWARSLENEIDGALSHVSVGGRFPPLVRVTVGAGPTWQRYAVPFTVKRDVSGDRLAMAINVGNQRQTLEFGGFALVRFEPEAAGVAALPRHDDPPGYPGMDDPQDAAWRVEARERIDQHRKADLTVRVVDAQGRPIPEARVRVAMQKHAFEWGNGADLGYFGGKLWSQIEPRYLNLGMEGFAKKGGTGRTFNQAGFGVGMKMRQWASAKANAKGDLDRTHVFRTIAWLRENGIDKVRGHTMMWGNFQSVPKWVQAEYKRLQQEEGQEQAMAYLLRVIREHVHQTTVDFRGRVYEWDMANEFLHRMLFEQALGYDGMVEEVADWFKIAYAADPECQFFVNDNRMLNQGGRSTLATNWIERFTRDLIEAGAPVHGIGLQGHLGKPLADPRRVYDVLEQLASVGVELKVTELDIGSSVSEMEVVRAGIQGEGKVETNVAGLYTRDFLTMVFSHPSVTGVQIWGFWDRNHWKRSAMIYDEQWNVKPTGEAYLDLIFNEWWTDEQLTTNAGGQADVRAFLGDYTIEVEHGGETRTVDLAHLEDQTVTVTW